MKYCTDKDVDRLIGGLVHSGWTFSRGKHGKLRPPRGAGCVTVSVSPSDRDTVHFFRRDVRRLAAAVNVDLPPALAR